MVSERGPIEWRTKIPTPLTYRMSLIQLVRRSCMEKNLGLYGKPRRIDSSSESMPKAFNCVSSPTTSMIQSSQELSSKARRKTAVILTPLTRKSLARSAGLALRLRDLFTPCFSAQATVSLPRFWDAIQKKRVPLSNALWCDTEALPILKKIGYQPMPVEVGLEVWMVEQYGYLAIRLDNASTYACLGICRM